MTRRAATLALLLSSAHAPAQTPSALALAKWDVNAPTGATIRPVRIATDEGSWMDVDVSPDGRTLAFALLGDLYTMPIAGGAATRIAEGLAYEAQPRWSPDGRRIAFVSDRGGGDNIWLMNADGGDKRQLTKESFRLLYQPNWSPDGRSIVAKKHFTTGRSLGTGEIWLYALAGGGGVPLVKRVSEAHQKELGEPVFAPDARGVYYTRNVTRGPIFEYAQDSNKPLFAIERYDMATGEVTTIAGGEGGAVRPTPSPDGRSIAFVRREATRSKLYVRDLASGVERKIDDALDQDVQETWAIAGVYPNMSWTPDSRSVVFWAGGKLRRVDADSGVAAVIPFRVDDTRGVADAPHPRIEVAPASVVTRMPRFAEVSPDGRQLVFETLGRLWLKPMAGGAARRLTSDAGDSFELFPSWSPDGRQIAYVGWTDVGLGRLRAIAATGGRPRDLLAAPGHYARPRWSPDGRTIVFERAAPDDLLSPAYAADPGVYRVASAGGAAALVTRDGGAPRFGASNDRLFLLVAKDGKRQLVSTDLHGEARRVHATGDLANDFIVSPDERWLAFRQNYEVWATPLMPGGQDVALDTKGGALPVVKLSSGGADYIHWAAGRLRWSMGPTLFGAAVDPLFAAAPDATLGATPTYVPPTTGVSMSMTVPAAKPVGTLAFTGARILTMAGGGTGAIDDGVLVVRGDRIVAVGARGAVAVPAGATIIDARGKTIMPGLVDAHAHGPQGADEIVPQRNWSSMANLALGTTTIHDPSARASEIFVASEYQRAGLILGPRVFSTGEIVYGAKSPEVYAEINGYDDALAHVRRLKAQGGHSVKNYNQPRREQRQQLIAAARAEGMQVVAEGGSLFGMDVTHIVDGNSTHEHNMPLGVFYKDVVDLWAGSQTNYTPTLVVTFGGLAGDPYWRQATSIFDQPLLRAHTPPALLRAAGARRLTAPDGDFVDAAAAREARKLAKRGVAVAIGAHGQQAGIGPHWELWSFVRGGMTPAEALRAGTIDSARSLGMAADIGSLEPGKLADLVVLDADPSADIRNSEKVAQVMLGGRLYDAATLNEVATGTRVRGPYWWEAATNAAAPPSRAASAR